MVDVWGEGGPGSDGPERHQCAEQSPGQHGGGPGGQAAAALGPGHVLHPAHLPGTIPQRVRADGVQSHPWPVHNLQHGGDHSDGDPGHLPTLCRYGPLLLEDTPDCLHEAKIPFRS